MAKLTKQGQKLTFMLMKPENNPSYFPEFLCIFDTYQASNSGNGLPASGVNFTFLLETKHDWSRIPKTVIRVNEPASESVFSRNGNL